MASPFKKTKRNLSGSSSESDEEITKFSRFIVLETQDDSPLATLSPFLIEKIISSILQPKTVKKLKKRKPHSRGRKKKQQKVIAYTHQNLNTSKGVVRSQELSLWF